MKNELLVLTLALVFVAGDAFGQEQYDCVIEPSMMVKLGSADEGIVEEVLVGRGVLVVKGQIIARLEAETERAALKAATERAAGDAGVEIARSRVELLAKDSERVATLAEKKLVAPTVLDNILSQHKQAQLELQRAEHDKLLATLDRVRVEARLKRRIIRSPIEGIVTARMIGPGEYVYSQAPIVQIAQIDPLYVEVFLPTHLYPGLKVGQRAVVKPAAPVSGEYTAEIVVIDQVFDAASDTFGVRLALSNTERRLPAGIDCTVGFAYSD